MESLFSIIWVTSIVVTLFIAYYKKLNTSCYFVLIILALCVGPLAIIVALLMIANSNDRKTYQGKLSLPEVQSRLNLIKDSISKLQQKVEALEKNILHLSDQEQVKDAIVQEPSSEVEESKKEEEPQKESEGFEVIFGKYWLNRIGVGLFVFGIGLFVSHTFQYLPAFAKILVGYLFSIGFLAWGSYLEKKDKYKKVAYGILGGGWALLYLSTYAMHYIEATQIITNSIIALSLLALVSIITIRYNLKYKSWIVTFLTFILAFITIGLGDVNYSTIIYCMLLAGGIGYISYKMRWHYFFICGITGYYVTYFLWVNPRLLNSFLVTKTLSVPIYQFQICFGILSVSWIIFSFALFLLRSDNKEDGRHLVTSMLINSAFFAFLGLYEMYRVRPHLSGQLDPRFWFLVIAALLYCSIGFLYKIYGSPRFIVVSTSIAFSLLTMAFVIRLPRLSIGFFWMGEILVLFLLGIYYKELVYRALASVLTLFLIFRLFIVDYLSYSFYAFGNIEVKHNLLIFVFSAVCFYMLSILFKQDATKEIIMNEEKRLYDASLPFLGTMLLTFIFGKEVKSKWLSIAWTLQAAGILGLGFLLKDRVYRICALCVFTLTCLRVIFIDISGINTIYKIIIFTFLGVALLSVSLIYSKYIAKNT